MFIYALPLRDLVERAAWVRLLIVVTILALLALVLITPNLLGGPPLELASLPVLVVGINKDESVWVVDVGGAVQPYLYAAIVLEARSIEPGSTYNVTSRLNDSYGLYLQILVNATAAFSLRTWLKDREGNYFEYNITASLTTVDGRTVIEIGLPDEADAPDQIRDPPDDFRTPVPRRGSL